MRGRRPSPTRGRSPVSTGAADVDQEPAGKSPKVSMVYGFVPPTIRSRDVRSALGLVVGPSHHRCCIQWHCVAGSRPSDTLSRQTLGGVHVGFPARTSASKPSLWTRLWTVFFDGFGRSSTSISFANHCRPSRNKLIRGFQTH